MEPFYPLHVRVCSRCWLAQLRRSSRRRRSSPSTPTSRRTRTRGSSTPVRYVETITARLGLTAREPRRRARLERRLPAPALRRRRGFPVLGIDPAANVAPAAEERGVPTIVEFFGVRAGASELVARGRQRRPRRRQQRARAGARPERLRRAASRSCSPPAARPRSSSPTSPRLLEGLQYDTIYHEHFSYFSLVTHLRGLRGARTRGRRRRGAAEPRRLASRLRGPRRPSSVRPSDAVRAPARARGGRGAPRRPSATAGSPSDVEESKRALLDAARSGCGGRASRSSATALRARATRSSTTAASAPTSSTTRSTATPTSTAGSRRAPTSRSTRRSGSPRRRPDVIVDPALEPGARDLAPSSPTRPNGARSWSSRSRPQRWSSLADRPG